VDVDSNAAQGRLFDDRGGHHAKGVVAEEVSGGESRRTTGPRTRTTAQRAVGSTTFRQWLTEGEHLILKCRRVSIASRRTAFGAKKMGVPYGIPILFAIEVDSNAAQGAFVR